MRCAGAIAVAALAALAAPAAARGDDPGLVTTAAVATAAPKAGPADAGTFGGELSVGGARATFHGVDMRLLDLRLGVGQRFARADVLGLPGAELGALVTLRAQVGSTEHGLDVRSGRLGLGLRVRKGRLTVGLDADAVLLLVDRASTSGRLTGTGWGAGADLAFDLFRWGAGALYVRIDGTLTRIGASDDAWLYAAGAGLGVRW